jgi:hypothetical protein
VAHGVGPDFNPHYKKKKKKKKTHFLIKVLCPTMKTQASGLQEERQQAHSGILSWPEIDPPSQALNALTTAL